MSNPVPSGKILLVEDNPDDQELTMMAFRRNNIANEVVVANDGVEALEMLFPSNGEAAESLPEIVILDLKLPRVMGFEVLQAIRAHDSTRFIPVIILTSSREERDLIECYKLGSNAYVQKPVDFNQFLEAVKQLGLFWLVLNLSPKPSRQSVVS